MNILMTILVDRLKIFWQHHFTYLDVHSWVVYFRWISRWSSWWANIKFWGLEMGHLVINHYPAHMCILEVNTGCRIVYNQHWLIKGGGISIIKRQILSKLSWAIIRVTSVTIVISFNSKEIILIKNKYSEIH